MRAIPGMHVSSSRLRRLLPALVAILVAGCATDGNIQQDTAPDPGAVSRGRPPLAVDFQYVFENEQTAEYFPFEGLSGLAWGEGGTLIVCDSARGRVYGLDPRTLTWQAFDNPGVRPYRPLAAEVDGFKVLVLDASSRAIHRFDLNGVYQDRIVELGRLDPAYESQPRDFDVDVDGRVVVTDTGEQQVLMLDSFMGLQSRIGHPGPHREQFDQPAGICYLPDGGFMVADTGNRRLQRFNRLGYGTAVIGGPFDPRNPFVAPIGLDSDRHGNVYVADAKGVVHVIDAGNRLVLTIGPDQPLESSLLAPVAVAVGPDGQLAIADRERAAVLVFRLLYE
jgi:sugar lactone lactonase YvrE